MKRRILTGDRTTGRLHLGHYVGSLQNRVDLQESHETFVLLADVQALTTHFENPALIGQSILEVALDNLAAGLKLENVCFVQQSRVPAIAELTVFFSMLVPVNVLRHNPTIKTEAKQYGFEELSYGFLGYPVSQAADILFCQADLVPVGEDQLPHLEQAHRIVRRFNELYGDGREILKRPEALRSRVGRLPGLDGSGKMGKSLGNALYLNDDAKTVHEKVFSAVTDYHRISSRDLGHPQLCTVYRYQTAFNPEEAEDICQRCRTGTIGCVACKHRLEQKLNELLDPMRARRAAYAQRKDLVLQAIDEGSRKACRLGEETLEQVKEAMGLALG